jgi:hypothetical protein
MADDKKLVQPFEVDEFDPSDPPESWLGVHITVEWSGNKWYTGQIQKYDPKTNQHFVLYQDGDKRWALLLSSPLSLHFLLTLLLCRWYILAEKTFKIHGSDSIYHGVAGAAIPYQGEFVPYVPRGTHLPFPHPLLSRLQPPFTFFFYLFAMPCARVVVCRAERPHSRAVSCVSGPEIH